MKICARIIRKIQTLPYGSYQRVPVKVNCPQRNDCGLPTVWGDLSTHLYASRAGGLSGRDATNYEVGARLMFSLFLIFSFTSIYTDRSSFKRTRRLIPLIYPLKYIPPYIEHTE